MILISNVVSVVLKHGCPASETTAAQPSCVCRFLSWLSVYESSDAQLVVFVLPVSRKHFKTVMCCAIISLQC